MGKRIQVIQDGLTPPPGTIGAALLNGELQLTRGDSLRPRRHAELLLETVLGIDRTTLYLRAKDKITPDQADKFTSLLKRRLACEPVQYLAGWAPFYGRNFIVGSGVFIPRFDTELIIECVLSADKKRSPRNAQLEILDICCGTGVIGITLALEILNSRVVLVDNSRAAIDYTVKNALAAMVNNRLSILMWDALSEPLPEWRERFDYITANPPYIPEHEISSLHPDVQNEPRNALSDGSDGLTFYKRWAKTVPSLLKENGVFFTEIGDGATGSVCDIFSKSFNRIATHLDISGKERVVELSK